ncbi:hypothetical protein UA38_11730 [Photobacterium kishitanii]|nr:hypothetical protein UA38_11730 [Photobacterium kishitanii]KJG60562.1 hypothetical protein UA42_14515 [Photobacterium kishitanii]KJG64864.1 hypothetical protein UA40_14210 [Photobacterium kishitanii]KJG68501.1 hypothetical protein UA41_16625 [Photobacterium kishitanii]OBU31215.1 hypothetical protein AYY23_20090 [Photobacterium kishitanii]
MHAKLFAVESFQRSKIDNDVELDLVGFPSLSIPRSRAGAASTKVLKNINKQQSKEAFLFII